MPTMISLPEAQELHECIGRAIADPAGGRALLARAQELAAVVVSDLLADDFTPLYERWRHGGWYVLNVRYPSGACGCVSANFADKRWRIVADLDRIPFDQVPTFRTRDEAAREEYRRTVQELS
jgi:hypothetical protein